MTPTSLAIAEYPLGLPYSQRVESLVCLVSSFIWTSNLCCSMTRSRSPSPNCIFFSKVAQRVSRGLPLGIVSSDEKSPSHLKAAKSWSFCSAFLKVVLEVIARVRSSLLEDETPTIFCVTSFQATGFSKRFCFSSLRNPMSTRTLTKSGEACVS